MRLRYLHLPRCGPLSDIAVNFGREELVSKALNLPRRGAVNFVVGVNGSGKSSILRAVYQAFLALRGGDAPKQPITLAWDIQQGDQTVTALFQMPEGTAKPAFILTERVAEGLTSNQWRELAQGLVNDLAAVRGDEVFGPRLQAHLPKRIIAYTSGSPELWTRLEHPDLHPVPDETGEYPAGAERPHGWSLEREWEEEQPARIATLLSAFSRAPSTLMPPLSGMGMPTNLPNGLVERLASELRPLADLSDKLAANLTPREVRLDQNYFRVDVHQLRYAGLVLALVQGAKELKGKTEQFSQEALRKYFIHQTAQRSRTGDARDLLNRIDWFWPTHLSIVYWDSEGRVTPRQYRELLCLTALADEVIVQPRERKRLVISLGPRSDIQLKSTFEAIFGKDLEPEWAKEVIKRVDQAPTGAEAVLRILSEDESLDSTPLDAFTRLREWEKTGLLEEVTLTVKRLTRPNEEDGPEEDRIITLDQMSDGEQVLLGRMGLLYLLRGQEGSLLLLDEPETHFNDAWKREMVEMMDAGLLDSTHASVLVATHTSIALTDAFAAEVTVLANGVARSVGGGLFGTDPGEVTMNLFGADGTTGSRAAEILDRLLKTDWKGREYELEQVLTVLGSSFHRAELRAVLKQLKTSSDATASGQSS